MTSGSRTRRAAAAGVAGRSSTPVAWLPADARACSLARHHVEQQLSAWGCDEDTAGDALLLVSELAGNVADHSPSRSVGIEVSATAHRVLVTVHEQSVADLPDADDHVLMTFDDTATRTPAAATEIRGRGLRILDALASEWGISRSHRTTATWFALTPAAPPPLAAVDPLAAAHVEVLEASVRRLQLLLRITEGLAAAVTPDDVGQVIARHLREHLRAVFIGIALIGTAGDTMHYLTLEPLPEITGQHWSVFAHDAASPVSAAASAGRSFFHESRDATETDFPGITPHMVAAGTGALAHVPLAVESRSFGTLSVAWADERVIDADTRALLLIVAGAASQALQRAGTQRPPETVGPTARTGGA